MGEMMKARSIAICAAAGVAVSAFAGVPAQADQYSGTIGFGSETIEPGYPVDIIGTCADPAFTTSPVVSAALEPVAISRVEDGSGGNGLRAHTTVKSDAGPGRYDVSFTCGGTAVRGYLTVVTGPVLANPAISVEPRKGRAGTKVEIELICPDQSPVTSAALRIGAARPVGGGGESRPYFELDATVKNVKPGAYRVSSTCAGKPISTTFTVLASAVPVKAQVPVKPKGAPETGGE
jgi:hypothetical protein